VVSGQWSVVKDLTSDDDERQDRDSVVSGPWSVVKELTSAENEGQTKARPPGDVAPRGPFCFCPGRVSAGAPRRWGPSRARCQK
jgi:hypothetical protein